MFWLRSFAPAGLGSQDDNVSAAAGKGVLGVVWTLDYFVGFAGLAGTGTTGISVTGRRARKKVTTRFS